MVKVMSYSNNILNKIDYFNILDLFYLLYILYKIEIGNNEEVYGETPISFFVYLDGKKIILFVRFVRFVVKNPEKFEVK